MAKGKSGVPRFGTKKSSTTPMSKVPVTPRTATRAKGGSNVRMGK